MLKVLCVVGARPNFMKIAAILKAFARADPPIETELLHTGQHYDYAMEGSFFADLGIPPPAINLEVGSSSHAIQTAEIMSRFEPVLDASQPSAVLVVGDVNSTLACSLVAAKRGVPVFHVEAGLRSYDWTMPEEVNRVLTDRLSTLLFTSEEASEQILLNEGIGGERIIFAGNVMIDVLLQQLQHSIPASDTLKRYTSKKQCLSVDRRGYGLVTMHRPSNVDDKIILHELFECLIALSGHLPLVFPMHPRTKSRLTEYGIDKLSHPNVMLIPPVKYRQMLGLTKSARIVLTDSGGLQEETSALGVPCLTLRENTERPITTDLGTNVVVGRDVDRIKREFYSAVEAGNVVRPTIPGWDGRAAERVANTVNDWAASVGA